MSQAAVPLVSVVLPVHDGERFLELALRSILAQTFRDFELLVVDDGSLDRSRAIAERIAGADPRVRVVARERGGLVASLNAGLDLARGALIARMDADDVALPHRFEHQVAAFEEHPELLALGTNSLLVDPDGDPICPWFACPVDHEAIERRLLSTSGGGTIVHPTVMMRKEAVIALGGYRVECELSEDLDLFLRLSERGQLGNLSEILLYYRQHLSSVGVARRGQQSASARRALADAWQRRGLPGSPPPVEGSQPRPQDQHLRSWGWLALQAGNLRTARKLARRAVRAAPLALDSWRLAACALRGH